MAANFREWYDKPELHGAMKKLRALSDESGIGMDELSLRWIVYHSILSDEDAIIVGASKVSQVSKAKE